LAKDKSDKAHSRYQRHLADLPWEGVAVKLILSVRKFFCLNPDCRRRIFCERLPGLAAPYAHKTLRLCSFSDQMPKFFISFDEVDQLGV
jgi:transposase